MKAMGWTLVVVAVILIVLALIGLLDTHRLMSNVPKTSDYCKHNLRSAKEAIILGMVIISMACAVFAMHYSRG